jgi:hypothetical protein
MWHEESAIDFITPREPASSWLSGGLLEGDRPGFEALTGGVAPRPARDAEAPRRGLHRLAGRHGATAAVERVALMIGEDDSIRIVGVAVDGQMAEVVQAMMAAA